MVKHKFDAWIRSLERRSQQRVDHFYAIERGASGLLHIHALVYAPGLTTARVKEAWYLGLSEADARPGSRVLLRRKRNRWKGGGLRRTVA